VLKLIQSVFQLSTRLRNICSVVFIIIVYSLINKTLANETEPLVKWYQIEYIIFEHLQTDDHILRYEDIPYPKKTNKQFSYITTNTQPASKFQFTQLPEDKMDLSDAYQKLKRSRAVEILDMSAWQQPLPETTVPPISINTSVSKKRSLFGELQLKKSRYTHAEFKLFLTQQISLPYQDFKDWLLDKNTKWKLIDLLLPLNNHFPFTKAIGISQLYQNIRYLGESRRIKEGEVHYIDHPVISAIITIKEVPSPLDMSNNFSNVGQ
jgi:hypothetical protein